jgi:hypothetical protein
MESTDGLLRVPRGQYLRIQLKQAPKTPKGSAAAGSGSSDSDGGVAPISMSDAEVKSLDSMDDPEVMKCYVSVSTFTSCVGMLETSALQNFGLKGDLDMYAASLLEGVLNKSTTPRGGALPEESFGKMQVTLSWCHIDRLNCVSKESLTAYHCSSSCPRTHQYMCTTSHHSKSDQSKIDMNALLHTLPNITADWQEAGREVQGSPGVLCALLRIPPRRPVQDPHAPCPALLAASA